MGEGEALIQRRKMLLDKILKMNNEVEKIDQRLDFLGKAAAAERLDRYGSIPPENKCRLALRIDPKKICNSVS
jgi:hypothetical protein